MSDLTLVIGNKNYSSWSMRAWLALKRTGADFTEIQILLDQPDTLENILIYSPTGKLPVLHHGKTVIWDSLAICEYAAETFPDAGLWPRSKEARARARAVCAEMHSGFEALRTHMHMNVRDSFPGKGTGEGVAGDIRRIIEIWETCRANFGDGGAFLFGEFSIADAMFAPVVSRFITYGVDISSTARDYMNAVWGTPEVQAWVAGALNEPFTILKYHPAPDTGIR
ncbi:MAG: glutathione S-transferase family protein [Rhodospirillales bacterium]|nr:glutathione S-transferase family protein [Rhodospirillales bacterium]